ncbi:PAS domain S-box protein [Clostridium grantii]|uniref:PAS domain S-box-containing protein/diguanylate cyclase (GGDEF) domain-containing protein n=1 Tax=Clostridium grantii DSM 8605 TaxID=1121316 RepID=A0A1M5SZX5_9CLOT|nr:PAS domain S-box protein [Clostridium grantii]SHH43920.1 PAS domain S-box-containing protein/diguanylate cyclase (GGDEF) domain-containing protein [Clostridium grantii DSM 8605]
MNILPIANNIKMTLFFIAGLIVIIIALLFINKSRRKMKIENYGLESLFDNMQEGFAIHEIICDENGNPVDYKFLDVNKSFENITGLKKNVIKNKTVKEILPQTEKEWIEKYGKVALTGEATSFSNYSKELGKHFNVSVYSPMKKQFITMFTDITEQVQAKEKSEMERNILEIILEDTLSGYWDWNIENETVYFSPSFKKMFGYENDEIENSNESWKKLIFQEDLQKLKYNFNRHVESQGRVAYYNEVRYHHKDGSIVWVICSGRVIEWSPENKPLKMVGCHINITSIKKLEEQLKKEKSLFQTTLHSLGDGVIATDKYGKIHIMNTVAEELTGWVYKEAKGLDAKEIFNIIDEHTKEKCENYVNQVLQTGNMVELENDIVLIKKNGEELSIEESIAPIKDKNNNINGAVIVFRDFTDKKEKQEKISYLSYHDQLTDLYNRRFFEEELVRLDTDRNLPFTIAMIDVNGLKLTNDAFGHLVGDELLRKVSDALKRECRSDDIIARIGGDEFIILFPKTNHEETQIIIKRIYKAISEEYFENGVISVSIGWDTKTSKEQEMKDIFIKAEEHMYSKKLTESQSMRNKTIKVIFDALYEKNGREKVHSEKVSLISKKIAEVMKLDDENIKEAETAGLMHDIGKISIDEEVLNKPKKLTEEEFQEVKKHPKNSYQILKSVDKYSSLAEYVLSHHERWDGTGYPRKLKNDEIPLIARIITLADAYESMTSCKPYNRRLTKKEAIEEIRKYSGTQFDPSVVEAFFTIDINDL